MQILTADEQHTMGTPQGRNTTDEVERLHVVSQIHDKKKVNGWVRAKEKGEPILVPEGEEFGQGMGPPSNMSAAEKLKWKKQQRMNTLPTVYGESTLQAIDATSKAKASVGAIPGSINWGIKPVNISIVENGKIGVTWVPVRDAATGSEAVTIESIAPGGQMDLHRQEGAPLCPGLALSRAAGRSTGGMSYSEVLEHVRSAGRPLELQFAGIAKDTPEEVQSALAKGEALPQNLDTSTAFHEMAGKSKVAAKLNGKVWSAERGRKRTATPVTVSAGDGGESGHVDITSAVPGKKTELLESLSYLEIQTFYVHKGSDEPHICFAHRPDPEGVPRNIKLYMPSDQATQLAEAVMALMQEIHERRNPNAAFEEGGSAAATIASAIFGGTTDNPMFGADEGDEDT